MDETIKGHVGTHMGMKNVPAPPPSPLLCPVFQHEGRTHKQYDATCLLGRYERPHT